VLKKIGSGVKKVVKAVVRYNPVTIGVRAAILGVLKGNVGNISSRQTIPRHYTSTSRSPQLEIRRMEKNSRCQE